MFLGRKSENCDSESVEMTLKLNCTSTIDIRDLFKALRDSYKNKNLAQAQFRRGSVIRKCITKLFTSTVPEKGENRNWTSRCARTVPFESLPSS